MNSDHSSLVAEPFRTSDSGACDIAPHRHRQGWTHVSDKRGVGWSLDGTDVVLYHDPLDRSGVLQGCWLAVGGGFDHEPIDHYLEGSMRYVESNAMSLKEDA